MLDNTSDRGDVLVLYGSRDGLRVDRIERLIPDPYLGASKFGASLAAGRFNNDPLVDLAVGAPGSFDGAGAVVVYHAALIGPLTMASVLTAEAASIDPEHDSRSENFGTTLAAGVFDNTGTGFGGDDLAIGAQSPNAVLGSNAGRIYLAHGAADATTRGLALLSDGPLVLSASPSLVANASLFASLLVPGDFDGDGIDDLAVGTPTATVVEDAGQLVDAGAVQVLRGATAGFATNEHPVLLQDMLGFRDEAEPGDEFGTALAVGDFDNDGFFDIVVGTPLEDDFDQADRGVVHFAYGTPNGLDTLPADDNSSQPLVPQFESGSGYRGRSLWRVAGRRRFQRRRLSRSRHRHTRTNWRERRGKYGMGASTVRQRPRSDNRLRTPHHT